MDRWLSKLIVAGVILILPLTSLLIPQIKAENPQDSDMLVRMLGGTADLVAQQAFQEAELYYHAGYKCDCPDEKENPKSEIRNPKQTGKSRIRKSEINLPLLNVVKRLHGEMAPKIHKHLQGEEEKELLPWFIAAVRLNPHFIDAWRVGSYWFYRTDNGHRAVDFISDGVRRNPGDYRLYLDRGVLYHRLEEWDNAIKDLETAEKLWKHCDEDSPYERRGIDTYLRDCRMHKKVTSEE